MLIVTPESSRTLLLREADIFADKNVPAKVFKCHCTQFNLLQSLKTTNFGGDASWHSSCKPFGASFLNQFTPEVFL